MKIFANKKFAFEYAHASRLRTHIYVYMHAYIHACTHIYTHKYMQINLCLRKSFVQSVRLAELGRTIYMHLSE